MRSEIKKLINKYILLLALSYLIEIVINRSLQDFTFIENFITNEGILTSLNLILALIINLIFVFIIEHDRKQAGVVAKHVAFATIIYRPLGVFAFLLYLLYSEKEETEVTRPIDLIRDEDI